MTSRVGIVVRTLDRPWFLARALDDIARQTFEEWQVVVVNDGGDPRAVAGAIDGAGLGSRVTTIHIAAGAGGRCIAANMGVRALDADYVVLHDDDDQWHPDFLSETVAWIDARPAAAGVVTATEIRYEERNGSGWREIGRAPFWSGMDRMSLSDLLSINRAVPISFLYRRSVHEEIGWYDETLEAVEDWELYLRILPVREIGFIPGTPLAYWSQRPSVQGGDGNSMFTIEEAHQRDDAIVRDRALAEWIKVHGPGLPLYIAATERRLERRLDESDARSRALMEELRKEIVANRPVWSRVRNVLRRLSPNKHG